MDDQPTRARPPGEPPPLPSAHPPPLPPVLPLARAPAPAPASAAVPPPPQELISTGTEITVGDDRCPYCQTGLAGSEEAVQCPACQALYHEDCWQENGGCAVYGCSYVPPVAKLSDVEIPVSYWGQEHKPCPVCSQQILAAAVRCRHCGAEFKDARPQDRAAFNAGMSLSLRLPRLKHQVVALFVCAALPCTAPLGALAAGLWWYAHRHETKALPALHYMLLRLAVVIGSLLTVSLILIAIFHSVISAFTGAGD